MPAGLTGSKRVEMTQLGEAIILLAEYDEDTQRDYLTSLAHMYKKAKVGDTQFKEICQGRAERARAENALFSTCGEFVMFLLERFGYRGPILNRDLWDREHKTKLKTWHAGKNIEYIFSLGRKEGVFVEYLLSKQKNKRPHPGDVVYVANQGDAMSEHVFLFDDLDVRADSVYEIWTSIDGGQGGRQTQHIAECTRLFDPRNGKLFGAEKLATGKYMPTGGGRSVIGWLNPALLELTAEANLRLPEA